MINEHTKKEIRDWKTEFREYFDNKLKPKKPTMGNLDRELCIDFIEKVVSFELASLDASRVEMVREMKFEMDVDEYLKFVEEWDGKNFDFAFDKGYKQATKDILTNVFNVKE